MNAFVMSCVYNQNLNKPVWYIIPYVLIFSFKNSVCEQQFTIRSKPEWPVKLQLLSSYGYCTYWSEHDLDGLGTKNTGRIHLTLHFKDMKGKAIAALISLPFKTA